MSYPTDRDRACAEIEAAKKAVEVATVAYRKGGSIDGVNKANRQLADSHDRYYQLTSGNIPTR
jgi:hypothetical protein